MKSSKNTASIRAWLVVVAMPRPSLAKLHPHLARVGIDPSLNTLTIKNYTGGSLIYFMFGGFWRSFGVFFVAIIEEFDSTSSSTSLIMGVRSLCITLSGPLCTLMLAYMQEGTIVMLAGIMGSLALMISYFATGIVFTVLSFGIGYGLSNGLAVIPVKVLIGKYFHERRSLASALSMTGASVGQMSFPPVLAWLLLYLNFRGVSLIFGALSLHVIAVGLYMRFAQNELEQREKQEGILLEIDCDINKITDGTKESLFTENIAKAKDIQEIDGVDIHNSNETEQNMYSDIELPELSIITKSETVPLALSEESLQSTHTNNGKGDEANDSDEESHVSIKSENCRTFLAKCLGLDLLRDPLYALTMGMIFFAFASFSNITMFLVARANDLGMSRETAAQLLVIVGGCDIVGRILLGLLADFKYFTPNGVIAGATFVTGIASCFVPLTTNFGGMAAFCVFFGVFGSVGQVLLMPVIVQFLGVKRLAKAIGMSIVFQGIGAAISPPLLGLIRDVTGSYNIVFIICGSWMLICCILMIVAYFISRCKMQNNTKQVQKEATDLLDDPQIRAAISQTDLT